MKKTPYECLPGAKPLNKRVGLFIAALSAGDILTKFENWGVLSIVGKTSFGGI